MTHAVNSGHPGGSLGCTEFMVALYFHHLRRNPTFTMEGHGEDLFFLSNGHISPVFYSVLARSGYFPVAELASFRKLNSRLQGHPATHEGLPGVRIATGSLGQGLSVACGAALAKKLSGDRHLVYSLHGDGELQEGQNWEAFLFAAHHGIDNLIATIDFNNKQIDGNVEDVLGLGDLRAKLLAFGWQALVVEQGNGLREVHASLVKAQGLSGAGKPTAIILRTKMGKGVDFMEDDHNWHGKAPNNDQLAMALAQLPQTLGDY
ncbi:MAG: transketolase [Bacteroidetes bacterium]|nr:transketolase [Bacteroidota bacterium]